MATKRLSLADRIALAHEEKTSPEILKEERRLINTLTAPQDQADIDPASGQGPQSSNQSGYSQDTDSNQSGSSQETDSNQLQSGRVQSPVSSQYPIKIQYTVYSIRSRSSIRSGSSIQSRYSQSPVSSIRS